MILRGEVTELKPLAYLPAIEIPGIGSLIKGGFPNPADEFFRDAINIGELLVKNPDSTYYGYAWSDSMEPIIYEGSMLLVDISVEIRNGNYAVVELDGDFCMKRFWKEEGVIKLYSENAKYEPIIVTEGMRFSIFGKIMNAIQSF